MHKVAIIGSGNIGTDLMIKVLRKSTSLEMGALAGVNASSEGLALGKRIGVPITDRIPSRSNVRSGSPRKRPAARCATGKNAE